MDKTANIAAKVNSPDPPAGGCWESSILMKKLAGDENAVVGVEPVAQVVEVEVAVRSVHVRVRHVDVAVRIRPPKYIRYRPCHHPWNIPLHEK